MQKSESIKELAAALCKFQASMGAITKDAENPFFKSKYASLSAIIEDTREPLANAGLSYAQFPTGKNCLETVLMHSSGEWVSEWFEINPVDSKPQSLGSAITYARRYALSAILGLQVEDDDGNEASKPTVAAKAKPTPPKAIASQRGALKKRIKELVDEIVMVPLEGGEAYKDWVKQETGYDLVEANYPNIIDALEGMSGN